MRTRSPQPIDIVCTKDLCVGVGQLQLGIRNLPLKHLCVEVMQLQLQDMYVS